MDTAIRRRLASFYGHSPCFLAFYAYPAAVPPCVVGSGTPCLPCRPAAAGVVLSMVCRHTACLASFFLYKGGKTSFQFSILKWNHKAAACPAAGADPVLCGHTLPALPPSLLRFYIGKRHSPAAAMPALRRRSTLPPLPAQVFAFLPSAAHAGARVCVCVCWLWSALPTLPPVLSTLPRLPCVIRNLKVNINFLSPQTRIK